MKNEYKPFIGKTITNIVESNGWITIYCNKGIMGFRLLSLKEERVLRAVREITK